MRRLLLIFLVCLIPLQSFAMSLAVTRISNSISMSMDQGAMPCHDMATQTIPDQEGCCSDPISCETLCSFSNALTPTFAIQHPPVSEDKPIGLFVAFISVTLTQPVKPPIL
jgi:hypothetical protein